LAPALAALAVYFGLPLLPYYSFGIAGALALFLYRLSLPVALLGLLALLVWGAIGAARALRRGSAVNQRHRALLVLSMAGLLMFGTARSIRGPLPTGSYLLEFDADVWRAASSLKWVEGDITPRQKMLGSLVDGLSRTHDRAQLEAMLGPSGDASSHSASTGPHLIYMLGPAREDFFPIDFEWLEIWLDASGHFERYEIHKT
jgi:hypothetical protein